MTRRICSLVAVVCLPIWTSSLVSSASHLQRRRLVQGPSRRSAGGTVRGQRRVQHGSSSNRLPHVSRRLQEEDLSKGCDKDKKGTCAPTATPSAAPSGQPSVSFQPTVSPMPSAAPSESAAPSFVPSPFPSSTPSDQPSAVPTITARPSLAPSSSPSDAPSAVPSVAPTPKPTETPTSYPTGSPSASPSLSQRPTITPQPTNTNFPTVDPNGYSTVVFIGPNRLPEKNSTCRPAIPSDATSVTNQVIAFDYVANVDPGSNITLAVSSISLRLQDELARQYLTCRFPLGQDFYTHAINSLPGDVVSTTSSCSSSQAVENSDCYIVDGAFTAVIFYLPESAKGSGNSSSRWLQDAGASSSSPSSDTTATNITDPNVYQSFSKALDDIFASGALQTAQVTGLEFQGVVNNNSPGPAPQSSNTSAIVGGIVGGLVLLILLVCVVYAVVQKHEHRRRYPQQVGPDDEDSLNRPYEDDPSAQEDQPFANIPKTSSPDERSEQQQDDEESLSLARNVRVVVVNEDESLLSGVPPPVNLYDDDAPDDEPKPPRFYKMRELGSPTSPHPSPTYYQPNPGRSYDVADTVDL